MLGNGEQMPTTSGPTPRDDKNARGPRKLTARVASHSTLAGQPVVAEDRLYRSALCAAKIQKKERDIQPFLGLEYPPGNVDCDTFYMVLAHFYPRVPCARLDHDEL